MGCQTAKKITLESNYSADQTVARAKTALENNRFMVPIIIPHHIIATKIGDNLSHHSVLVFGDPLFGTKLMKSDSAIAFELPLKMLVYENEKGQVFITIDDVSTYITKYEVKEHQKELNAMAQKLDQILNLVAH